MIIEIIFLFNPHNNPEIGTLAIPILQIRKWKQFVQIEGIKRHKLLLALSVLLCGRSLPHKREFDWWKKKAPLYTSLVISKDRGWFCIPKKSHEVLGHFQRGSLSSKREDVGLCGVRME